MTNQKKENLIMPEVGGKNLTFNINVDLFNNTFDFYFHDWGAVKEHELNYIEIKKQFEKGYVKIESFVSDTNLNLFVTHYLYDLTKSLHQKKIDTNTFISKTFETLKNYSIHVKNNPNYDPFWIYYEMYFNFYRLHRRYDLVLELLYTYNTTFDFSIIHDLEYNLKIKVLNAKLIFQKIKVSSQLNNIIKLKLDEYMFYIDNVLTDIYSNDYSFFSSLFKKRKSLIEINKEFTEKIAFKPTKEFVNQKLNDEKYLVYFNVRKKFEEKCEKFLIRYDEHYFTPVAGENQLSFNYFIEGILIEIFSSLIYSNQNAFRNSIGLPNIGQGWVSETNLFNTVKNYFNELKVIQHASPKWLGRQHLDIYLPELNIGIEYQGKQHSQPIGFFGGIDGHAKTIERDERKKIICVNNHCKLLFVYPETNIDEFIIELENIIFTLSQK